MEWLVEINIGVAGFSGEHWQPIVLCTQAQAEQWIEANACHPNVGGRALRVRRYGHAFAGTANDGRS